MIRRLLYGVIWGACLGASFGRITAAEEAPARHAPMRFGDESRLGRPFSKDPSVVRWGGRYLLYYSLPPWAPDRAPQGATKGWGIGIAESHDLVHWRPIGELQPEQPYETNGICAPGALVHNGCIHLVYQTYGNGPRDAICYAVSDDGLYFRRHTENPIFRPNGAWTVGRAIDGELVRYRGRWWLYFATRDPTMTTQMLGVAVTDAHDVPGPTGWRMAKDGPILAPELPWERRCIEAPSVVERDGRLWMFYAGGYNNEPQQIGVAVSDDGIHWRRWSDQPFLPCGGPNDWNASESGHPGVFVDADGETYLFFQGNRDRGKTWLISWVRVRWTTDGPRILPFEP